MLASATIEHSKLVILTDDFYFFKFLLAAYSDSKLMLLIFDAFHFQLNSVIKGTEAQ